MTLGLFIVRVLCLAGTLACVLVWIQRHTYVRIW